MGRYEDRVVEARTEVGTRLSEVLDAIRRVVGDDTPIYAHYALVHQAFDRHLVCSDDPYAHGVIFGSFGEVIGGRIVVPDSFHPTPEGHACLTGVFFALHPDPYEPAHEPDQSPEVGSTPPCP